MATLDDCLAIILAGGKGTRLYNLTKERAKPAVPFAGYRIIDIMISNLINAGMKYIDVLTEYKSDSLHGQLAKWNTYMGQACVITPVPTQMRTTSTMSRGGADSLYNHWFNRQEKSPSPKSYLVLSGDHITQFNPKDIMRYHSRNNADITLAVRKVRVEEAARQFGVVVVDKDSNIIGFEEKPEHPTEIPGEPGFCMANEANMVYNADVLDHYVRKFFKTREGQPDYDQSKHIITPLVEEGKLKIKAFDHTGYWEDVGTLDALFNANYDLIGSNPKFNMYDDKWWYNSPVEKYQGNGPKISDTGNVRASVINNGCIISGNIENSVLSYGIETRPGSKIRNSVLFDRCFAGQDSFVECSLLDKGSKIGRSAVITPQTLDIYLENGEVRGPNRNSYRAVAMGGKNGIPNDHILVQKSLDGQDVEQMVDSDGFPILGSDGYLDQIAMGKGNFIEFVVTPERRLVFSKYSKIPDGFRI